MDIFGFGSWHTDGKSAGSKDFSSYYEKFKKPKHWKRWVTVLVLLVALLAAAWGAFRFYMEYWQIQEIGEQFTAVFWTDLVAKGATMAGGFLVVFAIFLINVLLIKRIMLDKNLTLPFLRKKWPYVVLCFLLALLAGGVVSSDLYSKLLFALNSTSFGATDPLFGQDVGYYVFLRPFLRAATGTLKGVMLFQIVLVAAVYLIFYFKNGQRSIREIFQKERGSAIHIVVNILIYFLLMILTYRFAREDILYGTFGQGGELLGAGYVDVTIWLNYYRIIPYVLIAVILLVCVFLYKKKLVPLVVSILVIPAAFCLTGIAALAVQSLVVSPNERNVQTPYISHNMEATRAAYKLDDVSEQDFAVTNDLTAAEVTENRDAIDNIRITDFNATLTAYNQLQYLRRYYTFSDLDIVPYELDGTLHALSVSAREMNKDNLEESAQSYTNRVFRYTHGFGAVVSPINEVTPEGQPEFYVKDIPPQSVAGAPEIKQPRIYYGELTNDYVIVNPNNKELDYSEGNSDMENSYDGEGGIKLSFFKKLLFALHEGDYRMFFSGNIDGNSKILLNRNIMERVTRVAPFFTYDSDPYLVIDDNGDLIWVIDGYTTTNQYPYAQPTGGINYIRNSVKATVDAYDGTVRFYVIDESDPIVQTYRKIYPTLFTKGELPAELASHITLPQRMFAVQAEIYQRYHVADAGMFYDKNDVWRIATEKYTNNEIPVQPYFNIMQLDEETGDELVLTLPFVLGDKYNMVGLLMARTAPGHYGELVLYRFPKSETIYGPMQIENKIDNDPDISREMSLWGQGGSTVIRGNLLVVPFQDALLYVEPIYITSQNNASLPELKRVVVGYQDAIAMEATLPAALEKVFAETGLTVSLTDRAPAEGTAPPQEPQGGTTVPQGSLDALTQSVQAALDAYDKFKAASGSNDWEAMGSALSELEQSMSRLEQEGQPAQ